jgi:hypothetical protein
MAAFENAGAVSLPAASNDYRLKACISEATPFSLVSGGSYSHILLTPKKYLLADMFS